ncbi:hypothetical protein SMD44_04424 [Streptomyces alboflavus]|uniref:Uncharacterized protein n=1 Tax=Streptomyces alboflavus TaxID=67267 RepID=A0A1Z1WEU4_9ACTN|nr:hypothetical protein SMD44_04424 [Streptomyces alboflavus]
MSSTVRARTCPRAGPPASVTRSTAARAACAPSAWTVSASSLFEAKWKVREPTETSAAAAIWR